VQNAVGEHCFDDAGYSDEDEELSPEDRALMHQGTIDVKAALAGESSKVSTEQIQEALWHYYFDVDKSVAYLITKFIAPPQKVTNTAQKKKSSGKHPFFYTCHGSTRGSLNVPEAKLDCIPVWPGAERLRGEYRSFYLNPETFSI